MKISLVGVGLVLSAMSFAQSVGAKASAPATAKVGKPFTVNVMLTVPSGYHIYGSTEKSGIPTAISVSGPKGFVGKVNYPATSKYQSLDGPVNVYFKTVTIPVVVTPPKTAKGKQTLKIKVESQACNDRTCLIPKTDWLSVTVNIH